MITVERSPILAPQIIKKAQDENKILRMSFANRLNVGETISAVIGVIGATPDQTGDLQFSGQFIVTDFVRFTTTGGRNEVVATSLGDTLTSATAHGLLVGDRIKFRPLSACVFPTGVIEETLYFVESVPTATTFRVTCHSGGAAVTVGAGTLVTLIEYLINMRVSTSESQTLRAEGRLQVRT